jgi:hypothetical protein
MEYCDELYASADEVNHSFTPWRIEGGCRTRGAEDDGVV